MRVLSGLIAVLVGALIFVQPASANEWEADVGVDYLDSYGTALDADLELVSEDVPLEFHADYWGLDPHPEFNGDFTTDDWEVSVRNQWPLYVEAGYLNEEFGPGNDGTFVGAGTLFEGDSYKVGLNYRQGLEDGEFQRFGADLSIPVVEDLSLFGEGYHQLDHPVVGSYNHYEAGLKYEFTPEFTVDASVVDYDVQGFESTFQIGGTYHLD